MGVIKKQRDTKFVMWEIIKTVCANNCSQTLN